MRLDRFTINAQEALQEAQGRAQGRSHQRLEPEHLLLALLARRLLEGSVREGQTVQVDRNGEGLTFNGA